MASLTAGQLTNLRTNHPHVKQAHLSPVPEIPLLQAKVNDIGATLGDMAIPYDTGTGTPAEFALIQAGQTLLLGTTAGDDDLGRARVKSIAGNQVAGTVTVAWNYDVDWTDNAFITVLHLYELWPMFPRFVVSPENWLKDYDINYTDQNTDQYPVAIMGCGWAGFLVGGTATIALDANNSYAIAPGATITTYAWTVATHLAGAAPVIAAPGAAATTVTLDTAGLYWVKLVVTDSNGKTQSSFRPFIAHDSSDLPYYIERATRTQDWESGGCKLSFTVSGSATENEIPDRVPVILWSDNEYATVDVDVSFLSADEYADRAHVDFFGYVVSSGVGINYDGTGSVTFQAVTVESKLREKFEYPAPLIAHNGTIDEWWKFPKDELTVARGLHFLWRWHSTLFSVADVHLPESDTLVRAGIEEFTQGSLYERADSFARNKGIFAHVVCNIFGGVYVEIDSQMEDAATRAAMTDTFSLTTSDWKEEGLDLPIMPVNQAAHAYVSGGKWDGNKFTPYLSKWGDIANNDGVQVLHGDLIMVADQSDINMICGRLMALSNQELPEIRFDLAGNWSSAVGIAPQQWVRVTLLGTEGGNHRQIALSNIRTKIAHMTTQFNIDYGVVESSIVLQPEATGRDGIDGDYPDGITYDDPTPPAWPGEPWGDRSAVLFDNDNGCYFSYDQTNWLARNIGLAGDMLKMNGGMVPPGWWEYQRSSDPEDAIFLVPAEGYLLRSMDAGKSWTDITPVDDPPNSWSETPAPVVSDLSFRWIDAADAENLAAVAWEKRPGGIITESWVFLAGLEGWTKSGGLGTIVWQAADGSPANGSLEAAGAGPGLFTVQTVSPTIAIGEYVGYSSRLQYRYRVVAASAAGSVCDVILHWKLGGSNIVDTFPLIGVTGWVSRDIDISSLAGLNHELDYVEFDFTFTAGGGTARIDTINVTNLGSSDRGWLLVSDDVGDSWAWQGLDAVVEVRPIGVAIDKENLDYFYITILRNNNLYCEVRDSSLAFVRREDYGAVTKAQLDARTYWAFPKAIDDPTIANYGDYIYVYGRLPNFLGGGVAHLVRSVNVGVAWADIGDTAVWGANYVGGFVYFWGGNDLYAAVAGNLYVTANGGALWALASAMPHDVELGVDIGYDSGETMLIAHSDAVVPKVSRQASPYTGAWTNITDAFPNTGSTRGVYWV